MTFEKAARDQYRRSTFYTVWLVGPNGERESLGSAQRKSGKTLVTILLAPAVQARVSKLPGASHATFKKYADRLVISNGWRIEFGGTIRQEAAG